jgi:hypothetical protein
MYGNMQMVTLLPMWNIKVGSQSSALGTLVAHGLLGDAYNLLVIVQEGNVLHCRQELPWEEALACLHRLEPHLIVCRSKTRKRNCPAYETMVHYVWETLAMLVWSTASVKKGGSH